MALELSLSAITFSDGTIVRLEPSSVLIIVGPNNAGKSSALRDIRERLWTAPHQETAPTPVVTDVAIESAGTEDDLLDWLSQHAHVLPASLSMEELQYATPGIGNAFESSLRQGWQQRPKFGPLAHFFFALADGASRLGLADSTGVHDLTQQPPTSSLQVLFTDEERERELAEGTREAFGVPVVVNRVAGQQIHLHLGELPRDLGPPVATNATYRAAITALPLVMHQGDGMRAYVGLLLMLVASEYRAVLIDEPEAFLHPPQERALGRRLAQEAEKTKSQLVMATHSLDVLLGVLTASNANVTVVRLRRDGGVNRAAALQAERVRELWSDPIIRFSSVLDGIFHRGVVVCEGDADARFYDATLQATRTRDGAGEHGLLFVHCGGKQRVPVMVDALRSLEVPVRAVCDMDVLREEQPLRRILEALGGVWDEAVADWRIVRSAIDSGSGKRPLVADVRAEIDALLDAAKEMHLTRGQETKVRNIVRSDDAWRVLKRAGTAALPAGDAMQAWNRLDFALRASGLFVVPAGTLERWRPEVDRHGPGWVVPVLEEGFHEADGSHAKFVQEIDASIA